MEPYDDDDAMINDYIEEDFDEPPDEFDEDAFFEHAVATANECSTDVTAQPLFEAPMIDPEVGKDENISMDESSVQSASVREAFARGRNQADIFSFDRYKENSMWRSEKATSPMRAKEWKVIEKKLNDKFALGDNENITGTSAIKPAGPSAPDALILSFLQRPSYRKKHCCMPRDPVAGKSCLPMTLGDGTRVHIPALKLTDVQPKTSTRRPHSALGVSMEILMNRVQTARRKREYNKCIQQSHALDDAMQHLKEISTKTPSSITAWNLENSQLWVDKHAPSNFVHLLSDERCNREVVRALRGWDPYVFHREPPKRPDFQTNSSYTTSEQQSFSSKAGEKEAAKIKDKRPDETSRVLLLSGPPGVGKTTLAHIVARHAGYRPIEVNGSDERTETALTDRVVRAMESSTLSFGPDSYSIPNCLILDEIDGADASKAIQALVDIITADIPMKGTKAKVPYLRRPIIFICNNKFAPALKPLLPYSKHFNVKPPSTTRLVARLRSILTSEHTSLSGGSSLLNHLVTSSCGDIRSCLYTLQFASSRAKVLAATKSGGVCNGSTVDISKALQSALNGDGMKDERNDVVGTITTIFRKEREDKFGVTIAESGRKSSDKVLDAVRSFGDNSRILDCLFMNILRVSYIDPTLDKCAAAHEWMSSSDIYRSHKANGMDHYAMEALHIPFVTAAIHLLCRVELRQDLTYTTRDLADSQYQMEANSALAQKFAEGLSLRARGSRSLNQLATETVPYALWVLSAGEGSSALDRAATSVELLSRGERDAFERHAATLRVLGLSYAAEQEEATSGREHRHVLVKVRLEPPIERLVQYTDLPNNRQQIPPALKQMLSRVASHDRMRDFVGKDAATDQSEFIVSMDSNVAVNPTTKQMSNNYDAKENVPSLSGAKRSGQPTGMQSSKRKAQNFLLMGAKNAKAARSARTAARVGCFEKSSKQNKLSNTGSGVPLSKVVRLKYVKGFTQAVSTPCCLEDLA